MRKKIVFLLYTAIVLVAGLEFEVRSLGYVTRLHNRCANIYFPRIGYIHKPNIKSDFWVDGRRIDYSTNDIGFRDKDHDFTKLKHRFVVLGDSFVESPYTPLEATFPAILEKHTGIEMVNLGRMGMGTVAEYEIYKEFGMRFIPDGIILTFYINDIANNAWPAEDPDIFHLKLTDHGYEPVPPRFIPERSPWRKFINEHFYLYQYVGDLLHNRDGKKVAAAEVSGIESKMFLDPLPKEVEEAWKTTEFALQEFKALNVRVLVVYIPPVYNVQPNQVSGRLKNLCLKAGFEFLSLADYGIKPEHYYKTNQHLNAAGQYFAASAIVNHAGQFLYNEKSALRNN